MRLQPKSLLPVDLRVSDRRKTRYSGDCEPDSARRHVLQKTCQRGSEMGSKAQEPIAKSIGRRKSGRSLDGHTTMIYAEMERIAGKAGTAIELAKEALRSDPNHVGALEVLAKAQWQASQCDEVIHTLRRLIDLNPYEPGYHSLLAGAYQSLGLCGEAVKSYLRAVELGMPKSSDMDAMIEELRAWQGSLVSQLIESDPVFKAAYQQDPVKACAERGFDFAIPPESTELRIRDRESRAVVYARPS